MSNLQKLKKTLRKKTQLTLNKLTLNDIQVQSNLTYNTIINNEIFKKADSIGIYMNLPLSELQTYQIINYSITNNKLVYLPKIVPLSKFHDIKRHENQKSCLHFLNVKTIEEINNLPIKGKYKIREPDFEFNKEVEKSTPTNDLLINKRKLDILFLPGVAFTRTGERLGHGVGFYDDFIQRYEALHGDKPILIGLGLKEQLIANDTESNYLHMEEHDEPLDYVIINDKVYRCNEEN